MHRAPNGGAPVRAQDDDPGPRGRERSSLPAAAVATALVVLSTVWAAAAPPALSHASQARAQLAVRKGIAYLKRVQERDGSWSHYPATTALAVSALIRNGHSELKEPAVAAGIQFLLANEKPNGAIYSDQNPNTALPNYNTSLAIMALELTRNAAYRPIILKAQRYLEGSQFGADGGMNASNPLYGGIGYGSDPDDHPDLSNLSMALEALKETGVGPHAPVWSRALLFLQRVQNRRESNDQAWVKSGPNDGGFVYDTEGDSKTPAGGHTSMGAMTYAGLESYIYCGVSRSDPRAQAAWRWIKAHYTVQEHPNEGNTSLYYYYHTMAKTLDVYGQRIVHDSTGKAHDWEQDLADRLAALQHPDGSWFNTNSRYWENQPSLVTSYSLIALSYCLHPR